jgi:type II secretory pathway component PulF
MLIDSFIAHGGMISDAPRFSEILMNVFTFLLSIAGIIAIIVLVIAGLRYFFTQDETQVKLVKKSIEIIVIGLLVLFGSMIIIWQIGRFLQ